MWLLSDSNALVSTCRVKETKKLKNGETRVVERPKAPKFYPADDVPVKVPSAREAASKGIAKLRKSITPGTVLILLAGRFRGRRCVFLKQLASGLLLVTGPYAVNGIPLRRVNQAYVIATSTKVDVSKVDAKKSVDADFGKPKVPKSQKKKKEDFFGTAAEVHTTRTAGPLSPCPPMPHVLHAPYSLPPHAPCHPHVPFSPYGPCLPPPPTPPSARPTPPIHLAERRHAHALVAEHAVRRQKGGPDRC